MRRAGVSADSRVVIYDDAGGSVAARLWWLLAGFGHARAHVLDGGLPAWVAAGHPLATEVPAVPPGDFTARRDRPLPVVDRHQVDAGRDRPSWVLLDARVPPRYRGEIEPIDEIGRAHV